MGADAITSSSEAELKHSCSTSFISQHINDQNISLVNVKNIWDPSTNTESTNRLLNSNLLRSSYSNKTNDNRKNKRAAEFSQDQRGIEMTKVVDAVTRTNFRNQAAINLEILGAGRAGYSH